VKSGWFTTLESVRLLNGSSYLRNH